MKTKKEQFNHNFINNAEQFLKDLNDAKNESLYYNHEKTKYWDVPDTLQKRYDQAMHNLGRWLVKNEIL
jgi:hypothetical protein